MAKDFDKHRYCIECGIIIADIKHGFIIGLENCQVVKSDYYCKECANKIKK